jgi:hypothetical protein
MSTNTPSTSVPAWQNEFDERIKAFAEAVGVELEKVEEVLGELGVNGKTSQSLSIIDSEDFLPMGDLRAAFVDSGLTKIALLRSGMPHLRGATRLDTVAVSENDNVDKVSNAIQDMIAANRPKTDWKDRELLENYDRDATEIIEILGRKSKGRPCIVFDKKGNVNISVSLSLLQAAKRRSTNDRHLVDGKPVHVFRVGEFLDDPIDESPLCMGETLLDGYCAKSNTNWDGIDMKYRVLARIYVQHIETSPIGKAEMKKLWNEAKALNAKNVAIADITVDESELLVEAVHKYELLESQDQLPKLKIFSKHVRPERYTGRVDSGF